MDKTLYTSHYSYVISRIGGQPETVTFDPPVTPIGAVNSDLRISLPMDINDELKFFDSLGYELKFVGSNRIQLIQREPELLVREISWED